MNIEPKTVQYLVENYENIIAVKDATGNIGWTAQTAMLCGDKLDIYSGDDNAIVPILSFGGKGVISVLSHVAPRDTHLIVEKFLNGDTKGALELQLKYLPLVNLLFSEVNPIPVKTACKLLGFAAGPMRLPLTDMEPEHAELLAAEMRRLGLIK